MQAAAGIGRRRPPRGQGTAGGIVAPRRLRPGNALKGPPCGRQGRAGRPRALRCHGTAAGAACRSGPAPSARSAPPRTCARPWQAPGRVPVPAAAGPRACQSEERDDRMRRQREHVREPRLSRHNADAAHRHADPGRPGRPSVCAGAGPSLRLVRKRRPRAPADGWGGRGVGVGVGVGGAPQA